MFARAWCVVVCLTAAACVADPQEAPPPFDTVPIGESVPPAPRTNDLELAPGPDVEVTPSPVESPEALAQELGLTADALDQVLGEAPPVSAGVQTQSLLSGIGKAISGIVITAPKPQLGKIVIGGFRTGADVFGGKNLYMPKDESLTPEQLRFILMFLSGTACSQGRVAYQTVPAAQAQKLVAKFGGAAKNYRLCVPSTYVDKTTGNQTSIRVYLAGSSTLAYRAVTTMGAKTEVYELPAKIF